MGALEVAVALQYQKESHNAFVLLAIKEVDVTRKSALFFLSALVNLLFCRLPLYVIILIAVGGGAVLIGGVAFGVICYCKKRRGYTKIN